MKSEEFMLMLSLRDKVQQILLLKINSPRKGKQPGFKKRIANCFFVQQ